MASRTVREYTSVVSDHLCVWSFAVADTAQETEKDLFLGQTAESGTGFGVGHWTEAAELQGA